MYFRTKLFLCAVVFLSFIKVSAQDSLIYNSSRKADSVYHSKFSSVDSIQQHFHHRTDSVQKAFASPLNKLHSEIFSLEHKKDSLSRLQLPTQSLTHKIDSLQKVQASKTKELNASIEKVKKESLSKISSLHLPPQAQSEMDKLSRDISGYAVPVNFFKMPNLKLPGLNIPSLNTSSFNIPLNKIPSLALPSNFSIPSMSIPSLQKLDLKNIAQLPSLEKYKNELAQVKQLKSKANAKEMEKLALKEASKNISELKTLQGADTKLLDAKKQLDQAKDAKPEQALQMAVNHFAGKEQQLQSAMQQVSKYKQKYSSIKSLSEIPKRPPNPLKGKPWYERTLVGVNYFVMNKNYVLIDFNPYIAWKFSPHLSASIGWNERIGISHWNFHTQKYDRVFGLRTAVNYTWSHGIVFKLAPEVMNAFVPVNSNIDAKREEAIWNLYAGVRKDFPVYKKIKGYSEVLYNFTQSPGKNIYGDAVSFRIGIETTLQRKPKKGQSNLVTIKSILDPFEKKFKAIKSPKDSFDIICVDKLYGVASINGDTLIRPQFTSVRKFMRKTSPYFIVSKDGKFGAIDNKGRMIIRLEKTKPGQVKHELVLREIEAVDVKKFEKDFNYYKPK